jgi:hypothetical protein
VNSLSAAVYTSRNANRYCRLDATAYANRGEYYHTEVVASWTKPEDDLKSRAFGRSLVSMIRERGGTSQDKGVGQYMNNVGKYLEFIREREMLTALRV